MGNGTETLLEEDKMILRELAGKERKLREMVSRIVVFALDHKAR